MTYKELQTAAEGGDTVFVCAPFEHNGERRGGIDGRAPADFFRSNKTMPTAWDVRWDELADGWWVALKGTERNN